MFHLSKIRENSESILKIPYLAMTRSHRNIIEIGPLISSFSGMECEANESYDMLDSGSV